LCPFRWRLFLSLNGYTPSTPPNPVFKMNHD
jgi:hypothetical protein